MLPSEVVGGVAASFAATGATTAVLATELSSFTQFRDHIDEILRDLKASPAGPTKLREDPLTRPQFGGGDMQWAEAASLFISYRKVVTELESLSKLLSEAIEGMSIAVLASHKGYENLDIDIRRRMLAIADNAEEHYGGEYVPPEAGKPHADTQKPVGGDTAGTDGLSWQS
ncbi:hypothetical protein ACQSMD_19135 [Streptomyces flavovirens]|uniref:hypothetical protein n=1 Tax=Streptomyces TaxID=1883 RepID=UPI00081B9995|nr:hypothetical protein [Streptomyces sp. BpilaLS-43]SCD61017.1 hypothetical protein GA0115239_10434 [Streptomyces sp. BpilaLS-43]